MSRMHHALCAVPFIPYSKFQLHHLSSEIKNEGGQAGVLVALNVFDSLESVVGRFQ